MTPRIPTRDLIADLSNARDPELGDAENVCRADNRHLRLYVATWMLSDGTWDGDKAASKTALELYEGSGTGLLERAGHLTTTDVVAEVLQLLHRAEETT